MWLCFASALLCFFSTCFAGSFEDLCHVPVRFGKGVLTDHMTCVVEFPVETRNRKEAILVCETNSPYDVVAHMYGKETKCTYKKQYLCELDEFSLGDRCFAAESIGEFRTNNCNENRTLHTIRSKWELKWLSVMFARHTDTIWVGNLHESAELLQPIMPKKKGEYMRIIVQLRPTIKTRPGTAYYEESNKIHPHLCSRHAIAYDHTIRDISDVITEVGYTGTTELDSGNRMRAFSYMPLMIPVRGTKYGANVSELHESCRLFPNGYAASLEDFKDLGKFLKLRKQLGPGLYRTSVGRIKSHDTDPFKTCKYDDRYEIFRKKWIYRSVSGSSAIPPDSHWTYHYPSNTCADYPRATAAIDDYYKDIPAISRRPVLCTYGNPPDLPPFDYNDLCNDAAHWDHWEERCVCNVPEKDGKVKDPKLHKDDPWGAICYDCVTVTHISSIIFILDGSGSVGEVVFRQQKVFISQLLERIENIRVGIMVTSHDPDYYVKLDTYERNKARIQEFVENYGWPNAWTHFGASIHLARNELRAVESKRKTIVFFTDGDYDRCGYGGIFNALGFDVQTCYYSQFKEADEVHRLGMKLVVIVLEDGMRGRLSPDPQNSWRHIWRLVEGSPGGRQNVYTMPLRAWLPPDVLQNIYNEICQQRL